MLSQILRAIAFELLKFSLSSATRQVLPKVFARVDRELPGELAHRHSPKSIEGLFASAISDATEHAAIPEDVKGVLQLYSPLNNAIRNFR